MKPEPNSPTLKLAIGSRWTVLLNAGKRDGRQYWLCKCSCGTQRKIRESSITSGRSLSCGCLVVETASKLFTTHGASQTGEYNSWVNMRDRCNNPNNPSYAGYGARGIKICERWNDFTLFLADMGAKPSSKHSIERVNNDLGYQPDNCIWADSVTQNNNKRNNRLICVGGAVKSVLQWSKESGISYDVIMWRLNHGWSNERALTP